MPGILAGRQAACQAAASGHSTPCQRRLAASRGTALTHAALQEEAEKKPMEVEPADMAFLEELADRTERLWGALSATIAAVEADVAHSQTSAPAGAAPGSRMLPPGVLQVGPSTRHLLPQPTVAPQHLACMAQRFPLRHQLYPYPNRMVLLLQLMVLKGMDNLLG